MLREVYSLDTYKGKLQAAIYRLDNSIQEYAWEVFGELKEYQQEGALRCVTGMVDNKINDCDVLKVARSLIAEKVNAFSASAADVIIKIHLNGAFTDTTVNNIKQLFDCGALQGIADNKARLNLMPVIFGKRFHSAAIPFVVALHNKNALNIRTLKAVVALCIIYQGDYVRLDVISIERIAGVIKYIAGKTLLNNEIIKALHQLTEVISSIADPDIFNDIGNAIIFLSSHHHVRALNVDSIAAISRLVTENLLNARTLEAIMALHFNKHLNSSNISKIIERRQNHRIFYYFYDRSNIFAAIFWFFGFGDETKQIRKVVQISTVLKEAPSKISASFAPPQVSSNNSGKIGDDVFEEVPMERGTPPVVEAEVDGGCCCTQQ